MTTAAIAALVAVLALGYVEGLGRFYPSKRTWMRLRSRHGRRAVWAMRRRFEATAALRAPRVLALVLLGFVAAWIGAASLLDKRWHEVVFDVLPYAFVGVALLRTPSVLRRIAERMRAYEKDLGEDPDTDAGAGGDGGPAALAL